jgi:hypothetical protein
VDSAIEGAERLPEIMIIGLISAYDAFLIQIIKLILYKQGEIFFKSEKSITFSDLLKFESMEDAKNNLIEKEVEAVIRLSHHDQFVWMERNFDLKLREGLDIWPQFIEVCERRNLLTHTGGVASQSYLQNCKNNKVDVSHVRVGDKLSVDSKYFEQAVAAVYEVGIKLCYVLWRKFDKQDTLNADRTVNELCFDLIHGRAYQIAEAILRFSVDGFKGCTK